ncbi:hypothetical protein ACJW31_05G021200 [Castanea mollissima]
MEIEIRHEEDDMMSELYDTSMNGCTTTLDRLIHNDPLLLNRIPLTSFSETPLHISVLAGHLDFSRTLLLKKPQLAVELDSHGRCPLHLASAEGHIEIVQTLLQANNNACLIRDQDDRIPLHYAVMRGRVDVVRELIIAQPDSTRVVPDGGESILHVCVKYNQLEVLKLLVESMSDEGDFLNSKDSEGGNTILHLAVMLKQIKTVKYLLSVSKVKERANTSNEMGFTAIEALDHCPKDLKNVIIQNILMDAGVKREKNQINLPRPSVVVDHHEPAKPIRSSKKWWTKWLEYLSYRGDWLEEMRGTLMLVATVITTITFQPIVNPIGGVWQTDQNFSFERHGQMHKFECRAGTSVFACNKDHSVYFTFLICNTASFTASWCVIFLMISGFPLRTKVCMGVLTLLMCTTLTFLAFAYIIAFYLFLPVADYDETLLDSVLIISGGVQISLMAVIGMVILIHTIRFLAWLVAKIRKFILYMQKR